MKTNKPINVNHKVKCVDGSTIDVHSDSTCTGAFLCFPGDDHSLSLVVQDFGGTFLKYVGYRDGVCHAEDAIAISVDDKGAVTVQVIIPGGTPYEIPLEKLRELIEKHYK